jgi:predicted aspartyl protease
MIERMRRAGWLALVMVVLVTGAAGPGSAQTYRWTDENGTTTFVEGIDNVPPRYRSQAVQVGPRSKPAPEPAAVVRTEAVIRFKPGRQIIVDAQVNGSASCRLLLDTGAGHTLINPRVLRAAGVSLTRGTLSGKARGVAKDAEIDVQGVMLDSLEVGGARVTRLMVAAYDMDYSEADGLLGMDFLGRFDVSIDTAAGIVKLAPK